MEPAGSISDKATVGKEKERETMCQNPARRGCCVVFH